MQTIATGGSEGAGEEAPAGDAEVDMVEADIDRS